VRDQLSCDLAGEATILNLANGMYYTLNPIGTRIWNLIQQPKTLREINERVIRRRVKARTGIPKEKLTWAITTAGSFVPGATCLTRALALQCLL